MRDFKKFEVWNKAHKLTLKIYTISENYPTNELHGLVSQVRRASASVPTNIAEGAGKNTDAEFCRFLHISIASASEVEYLLLLSYELKFIDQNAYDQLNADIIEIRKMLIGLVMSIKSRIKK